MKFAAALVAAVLVSGCVYYPKRSEDYAPDCDVTELENNMVLTLDSTPLSFDCSGGDGRACLALIAATGASTAVVSGSIVVIGNTLHWVAKKGACAAKKYGKAARGL